MYVLYTCILCVRMSVSTHLNPIIYSLYLPVAVFRKNEFNLYPFYSKKKGGAGSSSLGGVGLSRKASFGASGGVRPFLHQYGVKGQQSTSDGVADKAGDSSDQGKHNSAPSTPVKSRVVRRTLSFGAQPSKGSNACGGGSKRTNLQPSSLSSSSCVSACSGGSSSAKQSSTYVPIAPAPPPPPSNSNKCVVARPCKYF